MTHFLGAQSRARLTGVHPDLVRVVELAITVSPQDFMVVQGVRSNEQMWAYWGKGRTRQECARAGVPVIYAMPGEAKVTWLRDPLMSNHRRMPDGFGHAVDLGSFPYGQGPAAYRAIWVAMSAAAKTLGVKIRAGIDWDGDAKLMETGESDLGHYELAA